MSKRKSRWYHGLQQQRPWANTYAHHCNSFFVKKEHLWKCSHVLLCCTILARKLFYSCHGVSSFTTYYFKILLFIIAKMKKKGGWHHPWVRVETQTQNLRVVGQDWHQNHQKLSHLKKKRITIQFSIFSLFLILRKHKTLATNKEI